MIEREFCRFLAAYIECMLWLAKDENGDMVSNIDETNIAPVAMEQIQKECADFCAATRDMWRLGGWSDDQAGHDFFLTRNGHGAGFWDRAFNVASEVCGRELTSNSKPYGEQDLYRGDDGKYYV